MDFDPAKLPFIKRIIKITPAKGEAPLLLHRNRIYILPTKSGLVFVFLLFVMLLGSINYNNNMGFLFTFMLGAVSMVSTLHAYRNLAGLKVSRGKAGAVFAGQTARYGICLENDLARERFALAVGEIEGSPVLTDVPGVKISCVELRHGAPERGILRLPPITIETRYPLGLFRAWSHVDLHMTCIVYPRPEAGHPVSPPAVSERGDSARHGFGSEDFSGFREYYAGDSPRHIAWKAYAGGKDLLTKLFDGKGRAALWFDFESLGGLDLEARLSRLCRFVLDAEAGGLAYGLSLPGRKLGPGAGDKHLHECLSALALYGKSEGGRKAVKQDAGFKDHHEL